MTSPGSGAVLGEARRGVLRRLCRGPTERASRDLHDPTERIAPRFPWARRSDLGSRTHGAATGWYGARRPGGRVDRTRRGGQHPGGCREAFPPSLRARCRRCRRAGAVGSGVVRHALRRAARPPGGPRGPEGQRPAEPHRHRAVEGRRVRLRRLGRGPRSRSRSTRRTWSTRPRSSTGPRRPRCQRWRRVQDPRLHAAADRGARLHVDRHVHADGLEPHPRRRRRGVVPRQRQRQAGPRGRQPVGRHDVDPQAGEAHRPRRRDQGRLRLPLREHHAHRRRRRHHRRAVHVQPRLRRLQGDLRHGHGVALAEQQAGPEPRALHDRHAHVHAGLQRPVGERRPDDQVRRLEPGRPARPQPVHRPEPGLRSDRGHL